MHIDILKEPTNNSVFNSELSRIQSKSLQYSLIPSLITVVCLAIVAIFSINMGLELTPTKTLYLFPAADDRSYIASLMGFMMIFFVITLSIKCTAYAFKAQLLDAPQSVYSEIQSMLNCDEIQKYINKVADQGRELKTCEIDSLKEYYSGYVKGQILNTTLK